MTSIQTSSQRKRTAILDAAAEEFLTYDYRETSINLVAEMVQFR